MSEIKQKTLRFYNDSDEDMKALEIIDNYKSFGCKSITQFIVKAVLNYNSEDAYSGMDIDKLATMVSNLVIKNLNCKLLKEEVPEKYSSNKLLTDESYDIFRNFMNTMQ